ncbi:AraC family transcriptional regulator [Ectothiorhodospiraceae bacterium WFHF3C12]|nr:AraC family transcriptional regulator [Ectothiorhodospiraceae bacterium WFHF3C12]
MIPSPTVNLHFSHAILQACERMAVPLSRDVAETVRNQPGRVPLTVQDDLWRGIAAADDDPLLGLRIGAEIQVGHLDSAGLLLMSCETLADALEALLEYFPIISEGSRVERISGTDGAGLRYLPAYDVCREMRVEAVFACMVHLTRWITGTTTSPAWIALAHAPRDDTGRYAELLGCPVRFDAEQYGLFYDRRAIETPLIQANPAMREHLQRVADQALASLSRTSMAAQVRTLVRHHPRWGKERIAELMGVSGRHLNRRLAEEGSSFKLLHDATLHNMAVEQLRGEASLRAIAEALGFADESGFAKAFRRWAGVTPAQFRRRSQSGADSPERARED